MAATGESSVEAVTRNPGGAAVTASRWLIQTVCVSGRSFECVGNHLVAVTDAEHRDTQLQDRRIENVGIFRVDGHRPTAEDDPDRGLLTDLGDGDVAGDDLAEDAGLAGPAGDQLGVLSPEVDDQDSITIMPCIHYLPMPTFCDFWRALPSLWRDGATMTSAFWNSLTSA